MVGEDGGYGEDGLPGEFGERGPQGLPGLLGNKGTFIVALSILNIAFYHTSYLRKQGSSWITRIPRHSWR